MIELTPSQERELRLYAGGEARTSSERPNSNLIRRFLLMKVPPHGQYTYRITEMGRTALAERPVDIPRPLRPCPPRGFGQR